MCVWLYHIALPSFIRMWPDLGKRAYSLCIQFFNFGDLHYLFGMTCTCTAFRDYRYTISLLFLKVSMLYNIPCDFYGSLNEQIGCVNYARFPKSGHICIWTAVAVILWYVHMWFAQYVPSCSIYTGSYVYSYMLSFHSYIHIHIYVVIYIASYITVFIHIIARLMSLGPNKHGGSVLWSK